MTSLVSVTNMTISNGGRTAVAATAAFALARTDAPLVGDVYFEVTVDVVNLGAGVGLLNTAETSYIGGSGNSFGVAHDGVVYRDSYTYLTNFDTPTALAAADVIRVAYKSSLAKWWIARNAEAWNNFIGGANPVTGSGGFDPSANGGPWFFGHSCQSTGFQVTFNFGASAFAYAIPAGFTPADYPMPQGVM